MMKRTFYNHFACLLIFFVPLLHAFTGKRTTLLPRSHSVNAARELVGWYKSIHQCTDENYWSWSLNPTYNRSFDNTHIESFLFGRQRFEVLGSRVAGRGDQALLADYFGLPSDYQGSICFSPFISTFIVDFDFFFGFDQIVKGLYGRVHAPIVHTTWDLNTREKVSVPGVLGFPAGYMGSTMIARAQLPTSLRQVMDNLITPISFGDMAESIAYGKILDRKARTRISDVQFAVGYDFYCTSKYHCGFNLRGSVPSGSKPNQEILFDPVIGNAHHAELGVGISWHITPWINDEETSYFGIYNDINITHLFKDRQKKSYDFTAQKAGSRYMLLERFYTINNADIHVDGVPVPKQYEGRLVPAINVTTLCSEVSFPVQVDCALMFAYHRACHLDINWGYAVWFRSAEKLHCRDAFPDNRYALKGDAQIYGFNAVNEPFKLSATQSQATIFGGQNGGNFVTNLYANNNVDNPAQATDTSNVNLLQLNLADSASFGIAQAPVKTASPALLLVDSDLNNDSALMPRALTHKLFINVGRVWNDYDRSPYLGIGGEVEWRCNCVDKNSAHSLWGVWIKGGFTK